MRRGLALGGGLVVLILLVLGVKGCLDARKNRELSDYARNVTQIVEETQQTSDTFFGKLEDPSSLSVTEFTTEVNADRSAMDNYASRIDSLGTPGDMGEAQSNLELVYELRSSAMTEIAERMSTALGTLGAKQATEAITRQMRKLLAADVIYETVVRPEINSVLADNGITGSDVPASVFLPDDGKWLDESAVSSAIGSVNGSSGDSADTTGVHGLGLVGTSINGTELAEGAPATVSGEEAPEVEVQVENQGGSTESGITVSVSVNGRALEGTISSIEPGATETAAILLTPAPKGEVALEVEVQTVPGEQISTNNKASYSVNFE